MAQKQGKKTKHTQDPDPLLQKEHEETIHALNAVFRQTFERVQKDYADVGRRMAESVNDALEEQDFMDFLYHFYNSSTAALQMPTKATEEDGYPQALTMALFMYKWGHQKAVNVPCHVEELLVWNRYLRQFMREFYSDIYAQNAKEYNENQES